LFTGSRFEFRHLLRQCPQRLVEPDILIDAIDGSGFDTAWAAVLIAAHASQAALYAVFLHSVKNRPQIVRPVVIAAWDQKLSGFDGCTGFTLCITKA